MAARPNIQSVAIESLTAPRYSFAEADRLAGVSRGTARRWLAGYAYRDAGGQRAVMPPMTLGKPAADAASFLDVVEIVAIGRLKRADFSTKAIRQIVQNCQQILGVSRPLTSVRFKVGGREIFVDRGETLVEVGRRKRMQAWNEVLAPFLVNLDYTGEVVSRWWPLGRAVPIVVDPSFGYGLPVIEGSGVRTEIIRERAEAGDLVEQIASDFNLDRLEVERALQFELQRAA
ncbi:MAG: DUF433 domain-containing protein [Chloroflexota bacterium]